jgi:putative DNA primase/helicase
VWLDDGRRVMHLGDRLLVDGVETKLTAHRSAYIYEQARPLKVTLGEPLTDAQGKAFLAMCRAVAWAEPVRDGSLFAGWIVSALVGGALAWRPHLWMLAEGGTGKTWVHDNIVVPALGDLALILQGKTTEAGIRGELGHDARPVLFDEAETQSDIDRVRMQQAIDLARQASSEHAAPIVKGTKEGGSRRFIIRASFLFASINAGLTQAADESRFHTLTMLGVNNVQDAIVALYELIGSGPPAPSGGVLDFSNPANSALIGAL